jgi:hypothetical protein
MEVLLDSVRPAAATLAILISVPTYVIYFRKIYQRSATPHVVTWLVLSFLTLSAAVLQFSKGAGWGAAPIFAAGAMNGVIAHIAWRRRYQPGYNTNVTQLDVVCGALAVLAWVVWLFANQPVLAVNALAAASLLAFWPTIRKSWHAPFSEPVQKYILSTVRYSLATVAVEQFTYVTAIYPALWIAVNGLFVAMLVVRQRQFALRSAGAAFSPTGGTG